MMKKLKNNITLLNVISNVLLQIVLIINGFIIPRIILTSFGSEVNGLVSSLNQFLSYINLFEGGLGSVVLANLYKPLYNKDNDKISSVVNATSKFYKRLAFFFIIYTLLIAIIYPLITNTSFSYMYILTLTLILSITLYIQFNFSLSYKLLLQADKKVYIVSFTQIFLTILNTILFVIISKIYPSIHALKLVSALVFLLQPIIFNYFVNKYFNINKKIKANSKLLSSRWDGFAINMAAFIHNNTDISILTLLTNLKTVSVYSVYALVTSGIKKIIQSVSSAISPTMGLVYAKGNADELNNKFELYEYIIFIITYFFFTVGILLITPFVLIYTKGVTDINYNQVLFGYLLIISEMLYCIREPYVSLAYSADKFKDIKWAAYIEAILNIVISLILVSKYGLIGVSIGTLIAMGYRTLYHIIFLSKNIISRSVFISFKKIIIFSLVSILCIYISINWFPINNLSIINWIIHAIIYSLIEGILCLFVSLIFYRNDLFIILKINNKKNNNNNSNNKSNGGDGEIPILDKDMIVSEFVNNDLFIINDNIELSSMQQISKMIREDNSIIRKIDFSLVDEDILDIILDETKIYGFKFNNDDFLRHGKYPKVLSNSYKFMRYVIDMDINNLAYIDIYSVDDDEYLRKIINYTFRKLYYLRKNGNNIMFDLKGTFMYMDIMNDKYFSECLRYIMNDKIKM